MAKKGGYSNISGGGLKAGLTRHNPRNEGDPSRKLPVKTSVNQDAVRTSVGKATNNLGPREA